MVLCTCVSRSARVIALLTRVRLQVRGALDAAVIVAVAVFPFPKWALKRYDVGYVWATVFAASIRSAAFVLCSMYSQWLLFLDEEQRKVRVAWAGSQGFGGNQCCKTLQAAGLPKEPTEAVRQVKRGTEATVATGGEHDHEEYDIGVRHAVV